MAVQRRRAERKRVAAVTGATGGCGRAVCLELARRGWSVAVGYHSKPGDAEDVAGKCRALGAKAVPIHLDVTSDESVAAFVRSATVALGPITDLVNVASYATPGGGYRIPLEKLDLGEVTRAVEIDLCGSLRMIRACSSSMRRAGGSIVNFGSASANAADPDLLVYMAAKVSLAAYTRALARELGPTIRVNCLAPGAIATDWIDAWKMPPKERRALAAATRVGRLGDAEDVAKLVAYLISDAASYITGQTVTIDGGMFNP
jgi:3-oxoacyl-[acyl-carrier protein] reductase